MGTVVVVVVVLVVLVEVVDGTDVVVGCSITGGSSPLERMTVRATTTMTTAAASAGLIQRRPPGVGEGRSGIEVSTFCMSRFLSLILSRRIDDDGNHEGEGALGGTGLAFRTSL
jgi:hypothetical protein